MALLLEDIIEPSKRQRQAIEEVISMLYCQDGYAISKG